MNILEHAERLIERFRASFTGAPEPEESPEGMPQTPNLQWYRMFRFAREPAGEKEVLKNAVRTYSSLAASGTWTVLVLVCDRQGMLTLCIGLAADRASAAIRGIQALQQSAAVACAPPVLPDKTVYGLEAAATGEEAVPLDALMDAMPPETALLLVLEPLANQQLQPLIGRIDWRRSQLSAMAQWTLQEGSNTGRSRSTNRTEGQTVSRGISDTSGTSTNDARVLARNTSDGTNHGVSLLSISSSSNHQSGRGANVVHGNGENHQHTNSDNTSQAVTEGVTEAENTGDSQSEQNAVRIMSFAEKEITLAARRKRFRRGIRQGMLKAAYYIIADAQEAGMLASMIRAALTADGAASPLAEDELPAAFSTLPDSEVGILMQGRHPPGHGRICLPSEVASIFPLREHRGLSVTERPKFSQNIIMEDHDAHPLAVGYILNQNGEPVGRAYLDLKTFTEHICVIGPSGVGKSNGLRVLTQGVLQELPDTGVTVIDPKNEWLPSDLGEGARLFTALADGSGGDVLRINPFAVSKATSVQSHVDQLTRILCGIWPLYAAMESILKQAIVRSYEYCGWDLANNVRVPLYKRPVWPDWRIISRQTRTVVKENHFSARNELDYIAALCTRMDQLTVNTAAEIFVQDERALTPEELFGARTVIHLQTLSHSDLPLVMSILALMLKEYSAEKAAGQRNLPLARMVVFEEAHNIIPNAPVSDNPESVSVTGAASQAVVEMTKELRSLGTSLVLANQSFLDIDINAVNNCGTKLLFAQGNSRDSAEAEACIGLGEDKAFYMSRLKRGECIVYQRCMNNEPMLVKLDKAQERAVTSQGYDPQNIRAWKTNVVRLLLQVIPDAADGRWQALMQYSGVPADLRRLCAARVQAMAGLDAEGVCQALHGLLAILMGSLLKILPFPENTDDERRLRFYFKQLTDACHTYVDMKAFSEAERQQLAGMLAYPCLRNADEARAALIRTSIRAAA